MPAMEIHTRGELVHWRGPAPFHFVSLPVVKSAMIQKLAPQLSYGWGAIPVTVTIGETTFTTSLFPKNGLYLVPIKNVVRDAEQLELGRMVSLRLTLKLREASR